MRLQSFVTICAISLTTSTAHAAGSETTGQWSYDGDTGPSHWGELAENYGACASGTQQSPIDLTGALEAKADPVVFNWNKDADWTTVNNGHSIQENAEDAGGIEIGGTSYKLVQFHFHAPSEHTLEGEHAEMEAHFVHQSEDGALAVVGVLINGGGENAAFDQIMPTAPKDQGETHFGQIDLESLLPEDRSFLRYAGSLTTPPCTENVLWTVMKEPIQVSDTAIAAFTALYDHDNRPIQLANRRYLLSGN